MHRVKLFHILFVFLVLGSYCNEDKYEREGFIYEWGAISLIPTEARPGMEFHLGLAW